MKMKGGTSTSTSTSTNTNTNTSTSTDTNTPTRNNTNDAPTRRTRSACVIGAGPSGLVAAKYLLSSGGLDCQNGEDKLTVTIIESACTLGGAFSNKVYDNTCLVSSKFITAFSDYRMPDSYPDHPTADQYIEYLKGYCDKFHLMDKIRFRCEVVSLSPLEKNAGQDRGYTVAYRDNNTDTITDTDKDGILCIEQFDVVAVCSGLHNTPNIPHVPNIDSFRGITLHSSNYKEPSLFSDKRVLVLGSGETAMDIAYRAIQNPCCSSVGMCVRRGFLSVPYSIADGRPLDVFITNLFEHAYEHAYVQKLRLRWMLSTIVIRFFLLLTGSSVGFNQWACQVDQVSRGYHIINKSNAAMAHLNVPIKRQTKWGRFWMWVYGEEGLRPIDSFHKTQVANIEKNGVTVRFQDGRTFDADVIVMATGYKQSFPFLDDRIKNDHHSGRMRSIAAQQNATTRDDICQEACTYTLEEDALPSEHFIVSPKRPGLGFIGFVRPNVGAIPPMSELQVMWWLRHLSGKIHRLQILPDNGNTNGLSKMPQSRPQPPSYMVLGRKYPYGVDYGNYMHRVAEDLGAAPTITGLITHSSKPFRALYTYCQGQAHIPLFRLQGPYASKLCWDVVTGELWTVCINRGTGENIGLFMVTWLSLWMNLTAWFIEYTLLALGLVQ